MNRVSKNQIALAINLYLKDNAKDPEIYKKVVDFLNRKRLISKSTDILKKLKELIYKENGITEVKLSSVRGIKTEEKNQIAQIIHKKYHSREIVWNEVIKEDLIGGVKIEVEDEIIDLTFKNKIKQLKIHLENSI